jgi:hypothetical protein
VSASPLIVLERAVLVHRLLERADVPHAFGGALALAYHVAEPRATRDIDLNVTADPDRPQDLFALLPSDVPWTDADVAAVRRSGQVRLRWPHPDRGAPIPLDLFFPQHAFHGVVSRRAVLVAMLDATVPVVSATDLLVFKVLFDRRKDWADVEELLRHGCVDLEDAVGWLCDIVGAQDRRLASLHELAVEVAASPVPDDPTPFG